MYIYIYIYMFMRKKMRTFFKNWVRPARKIQNSTPTHTFKWSCP